jgi:hypothetical protein
MGWISRDILPKTPKIDSWLNWGFLILLTTGIVTEDDHVDVTAPVTPLGNLANAELAAHILLYTCGVALCMDFCV